MQISSEWNIDEALPDRQLSTEQAAKDIYSDHGFKVCCNNKNLDINLGTYNLMGRGQDFTSGFTFPADQQHQAREKSGDLNNQRLDKINQLIETVIVNYKLDLLAIEEADFSHLKDPPGFISKRNELQTALLYNQNRFNTWNPGDLGLAEPEVNTQVFNELVFEFLEEKTTGKKLVAFSGYGAHKDDYDEQPLASTMTALAKPFTDKGIPVIFLGDWNNRFTRTTHGLCDNANNLIPPRFRANSGSYDSTDAFILCEKNKPLRQLNSRTIDQNNPQNFISDQAKTLLNRIENPYRKVFGPQLHSLPVGKGMNTTNFLERLFGNQHFLPEGLQFEVWSALRTNEKKLIIRSPNPIRLIQLEEIIPEFSKGIYTYTLEFAYQAIDKNYKPGTRYDDFSLRVNGDVKSYSLSIENWENQRSKKDAKILGGLLLGISGFGAVSGAILGSFVPGIGTAIGALFGVGLGFAAGLVASGSQGLIRERLIGGYFHGERAMAGGFFIVGATGLGAIIGTIIFPGLGSIIGAAVGAGVGTIPAIIGVKQDLELPTFELKSTSHGKMLSGMNAGDKPGDSEEESDHLSSSTECSWLEPNNPAAGSDSEPEFESGIFVPR